ncbi:hypothetical protein [Dietzia alimentaria]|uniref:hypothetical protein n=1 Tax=Dietzia alimentaria TaxID=665550 RepID=UPI00029A2801|nr:hypothetical protein [Dietzia alimentaria]
MAKYTLLADQWDQVVSKPNEPFQFVRHRKGETVELTGADERRLLRVGAVEPAPRGRSTRKSAPEPGAKAPAATDKTPEEPTPADPDGSDPGSDDEGGPDEPEPVAKPAKTAPVAKWREYAVGQGMEPDEADAAERADLIAQFG